MYLVFKYRACILRLDKICFETDSQVAVSLLTNASMIRHDEAGVLAQSCKLSLAQFRHCEVVHVRREGNKVAHKLARKSLDMGGEQVWMGMIPPHVGELVTADYRS